MQVMTVLPQEDLRGIEAATQAAELAGYDQISSMENRYDPLLPLGIAAVASKKIISAPPLLLPFLDHPWWSPTAAGTFKKRQRGALF
jgi:hypothetical protein